MVCARVRTHQRRDCASRSTISIALRSEHCGTVAARVSSRSTISPSTSWNCAAATFFFLFRSKTGSKPDRVPMPTRYWLMKCEPASYTVDDLARDTRTGWAGVRNYQARNFMRADMQKGDLV